MHIAKSITLRVGTVGWTIPITVHVCMKHGLLVPIPGHGMGARMLVSLRCQDHTSRGNSQRSLCAAACFEQQILKGRFVSMLLANRTTIGRML